MTWPYFRCPIHCSPRQAQCLSLQVVGPSGGLSIEPLRAGLDGECPSWVWLQKRALISVTGVRCSSPLLADSYKVFEMLLVWLPSPWDHFTLKYPTRAFCPDNTAPRSTGTDKVLHHVRVVLHGRRIWCTDEFYLNTVPRGQLLLDESFKLLSVATQRTILDVQTS